VGCQNEQEFLDLQNSAHAENWAVKFLKPVQYIFFLYDDMASTQG